MRVSYNWLKQYLDLKIPAQELARRLTLAGLEYDEIISVGGDFSGVVVGKVLSAEPVAGSDHLSLCRVDAGTLEPLDIICGAPNVRTGLLVACAKVGARLPGGLEIGPRKAFGITSQGMLCSQQELGISDDHSGIWELNDLLAEGALLGVDVADALQLRDEVIGVELTPNRGDCLGMINLAREVAVMTGGSVCFPNLSYEEKGEPVDAAISIEVADAKLCPRYTARLVKDVKIGPSPLWMQKYLLAAGMRPINNVVDISNYVMLEINQPLHTFDYAKLRQQKIVVRPAKPNETMTTLDGKERLFQGGEILICDGIGPVCIGGIMGGLESEVTPATSEVLIEAAAFDPVSIRRTARRLGIPSEASLRFEKGIDIANCDTAARRAAQLLVKYCGGIACSGVVDVCAGLPPAVKVTLRAARVNQILGTNFELLEIKEVFSRLGFAQEMPAPGVLEVSIPSYRKDISLEVDLIEEVARIKGFELIPKTMPLNATVGGRSPEQQLLRHFKILAADCGLNEAVNYSFIHPEEAELLQLKPDHPWRRNLTLSNPLSEDQSVMRQSLLPGLLHTAGRNLSRRNLDLRFFEVGTLFIPAPDYAEQVQPQEISSVAMVLAGQPEASWLGQLGEYDYFSLKGIVERLAEVIGAGTLFFQRCEEDYLHPGRAASIMLDGLKLGVIGELHPQVAENYQLAGRVIVAELALEPLFIAALSRGNQDHDLPRYPASTRDIAVIGSDAVAERQIAATIREAGGAILRSVRLFDLYDQPPIASGQRSLAYNLEFRDDSRTLTDNEVDETFAAIVRALNEKYAYQLR